MELDFFSQKHMVDLMVQLVQVPSISGTVSEQAMGEKIIDYLHTIPYFQKNPQHIHRIPLPGDPLKRFSIGALLEGKGDATVILLNHMDVVDILDYEVDGELAFDPYRLTEALQHRDLPQEAREDLVGGDYLFGRGVADMKGGMALQLNLLHHFSEEDLWGNILFLSVCDEETSSKGILSSLPFLLKLKEEGFHFQAVINCEPNFPAYPGDGGNYLYTGSMGKALVMFCFYGKETHAGDSLAGLNANLMASRITCLLEGNVGFCDGERELLSPPPTCLKQMDFKRLYSAQIPHHAMSYFNIPLLHRSPKELLRQLKKLCQEGFQELLHGMEEERRRYCWARDIDFSPHPWTPRVLLYSTFLKEVEGEVGAPALQRHMDNIYTRAMGTLDEREMAFQLVDGLHNLSSIKDPLIVIGFLPPYYPPVTTCGGREGEEGIFHVLEDLAERAQREFQEEITISPFFPGLSDLSYFSLGNSEDLEEGVVPNLPGWGTTYSLPLSAMKELQIPVLNLGVQGRDAHQYTERIGLTYSFNVLPRLLHRLVLSLLKEAKDQKKGG